MKSILKGILFLLFQLILGIVFCFIVGYIISTLGYHLGNKLFFLEMLAIIIIYLLYYFGVLKLSLKMQKNNYFIFRLFFWILFIFGFISIGYFSQLSIDNFSNHYGFSIISNSGFLSAIKLTMFIYFIFPIIDFVVDFFRDNRIRVVIQHEAM